MKEHNLLLYAIIICVCAAAVAFLFYAGSAVVGIVNQDFVLLKDVLLGN